MTNHLAHNIITRGNMNISALTKGFILPQFRYEIRRSRHGGGSSYGEGYNELHKDLDRHKLSGITQEDYDIFVYVDWDGKQDKHGKEIYVELIQNKIEVQLLTDTNEKYKINVELIE